MPQHANRDANAALKARFADVQSRYERLRDGLGDLQTRLAALEVGAQSEDELIRAWVGPRGQLIRLELSPEVYREYQPAELAATVTEVVALGATLAAAQVQELLADYLPPGSGALDYLRDGSFGSLLRDSDARMKEATE